ncbi:type II toxin-antitoxin system Phd/YefM family antitoxin [Myxococcota bacterium]|nr:type II toxin-antitoxin system Phd/YefM family antitoxin [Myxococcota bacterium]
MKAIHARYTASISELKKNPSSLLKAADGAPIAILNHNTTTAYLIPAATWDIVAEALEDYELGPLIKERLKQEAEAVEVSLDDL